MVKFDRTGNEKFIDMNGALLCKEYDKICGANKNLARITPLYIDGLKPVHRRALYSMFKTGGVKNMQKVASISGETFANYHPHTPVSIEDALAGIAQPWNNIIPLIDGKGNWGNLAGDPVAASRYIEAKLSNYSYKCFFEDWSEAVVDMMPSFKDGVEEPEYLPAKYPNILLNGSLGIGYGMACNIPPFNFREVAESCIILMSNPEANIVLVPDSPTGCDIIESNFKKMSDVGNGSYSMRFKYDVDDDKNMIIITSLPYQVYANRIREKIADIKLEGGLPELIRMDDHSGQSIHMELTVRQDVNPYKFIMKLIKEVPGLEKSYPVNVTVVNDFESFDYSLKRLLVEWISYRREQKRIVVSHKRSSILSEERTNDVKIFLLNDDNLDDIIALFRRSRNRKETELALIEKYKDSEIQMDSMQASAISDMKMHQLNKESHQVCIDRRVELKEELKEVEQILSAENGIDELIIGELREGIKLFGTIRKSSIVPREISIDTDVDGKCILQLSSDGIISRKIASNIKEEPVPLDINGFAVKVDNDSAFIAIDEKGYTSFITVSELPVDLEVPLNRYIKQQLGNIITLLPFDISSTMCCTVISSEGILKKMRISDMKPSKRPCISIGKNDKLISGIVTESKSYKDILVYTKSGMGQRFDPNNIRITSFTAKGGPGFKLKHGDAIEGCYAINPEHQYLLYVTTKGKMRLNLTKYLPLRDSKHDAMVELITLNDREYLLRVIGCNKLDTIQVFFDDGSEEDVLVKKIEEGTMSSRPVKVVKKNMVSTTIVKVKLI